MPMKILFKGLRVGRSQRPLTKSGRFEEKKCKRRGIHSSAVKNSRLLNLTL